MRLCDLRNLRFSSPRDPRDDDDDLVCDRGDDGTR
jgi:hypothetical protein